MVYLLMSLNKKGVLIFAVVCGRASGCRPVVAQLRPHTTKWSFLLGKIIALYSDSNYLQM